MKYPIPILEDIKSAAAKRGCHINLIPKFFLSRRLRNFRDVLIPNGKSEYVSGKEYS